MNQTTLLRLLTGAALAITPALAQKDFGLDTEKSLAARSLELFGIDAPIAGPATAADYVPRASATASQRVKLAAGLTASFVTRGAAANADMIALYPATNPTHAIICIEAGRSQGGTNPGVQRVNLTSGQVETILFGTNGCDGIRTTAWGTVLATEEVDDGRAYEILSPLTTTGQWVDNRGSGLIRVSANLTSAISTNVVQRQALPTMAWEGLEILPSGVVIAGDELRPGTAKLDADGGAIFKFVPDSPRTGSGLTAILTLAQSPLVSGRSYALTVSCVAQGSSFPQYGQGCEIGTGAWVRVDPLKARAEAVAKGATGYYRPEDLHGDPSFKGTGTRFCWTNTGNEDGKNYGEVVCGIDAKPTPVAQEWRDTRTGFDYLSDGGTARTNLTAVEVNRFLEGDTRLNQPDNLEFQADTGITYVIEDHPYGEIFACLPDGADRDNKTDGCISILSVADPDAEPTGFVFDPTGRTAYVNIQHGEQTGLGVTDDMLRITGFKTPVK